ncbi:MAG: Bug family tripartite tricarboxylate transporter substrate binding protein [Burkholderiales bacterium]
MKSIPRASIFAAMIAMGACAVPLQTSAQSYPSKPVRMVLALGGGGETLARFIGQKMGESMGHPIIVDPQPAAAGVVGANMVAKSAPDGYTFLYAATNSQVYRLALSRNTPYDPIKDFSSISLLSDAVLVVAVPPNSPIKNMRDYVEQAKGGKLFYGTSGVGTSHHLSAEVLQLAANIKLTHVPFKDPNLVATEVIADRLTSGFGIFGTMFQHHTAGKLRIIAINNSKRYSRTPDIPTVTEGVPNYDPPPGWNGFFGPANMPRPIVQRLNAEIHKASNAPDMKERFDQLGFIMTLSTPEELDAAMKRDLVRAAKLVKDAGIPIE